MTPRDTLISAILLIGAISAAWALLQAPAPRRAAFSAPKVAVAEPASAPPVIVFADRGELAAVRHRVAEDLIVLDLDGLEDAESAWALAAGWRGKLGDRTPLECWVVGRDAFARMQAAARLVLDACDRVVVTDALA